MNIAITGGGVGGLTLASALLAKGHEVVVIERSSTLSGVGAGLLLHQHALDALERCGVTVRGRAYEGLRVGLASGRMLPAVPRAGVATTRPDLHAALVASTQGARVLLNTTVRRSESMSGGVELHLSCGNSFVVDVLVGADGLGSQLRAGLGCAAVRRYSGATCWRGLTDADTGLRTPVELWGRGTRVGVVPLLSGTYLFVTRAQPATLRSALPLDALTHYPAWVLTLLNGVGTWLQHDLDELDSHHWGGGRRVLLGDAAHGFTPNLGEGAAQAILDADWLRGCLDPERGVVNYPGPRRAVNAQVAWRSRWVGRVAQAGGWLGAVRDTAMWPMLER